MQDFTVLELLTVCVCDKQMSDSDKKQLLSKLESEIANVFVINDCILMVGQGKYLSEKECCDKYDIKCIHDTN